MSGGWSSDQTKQEYSEHTDGVLRWHGEDVLDEERVELHHLPDQHELDHCDQSHVARVRIQPPDQSDFSIV